MKNNNKKALLKKMKDNEGRGLNYILKLASKILENPIVMFDITYKLLAHTENNVKDDFLWNELIELGTFSHETVNFFSKEKFIDDVANTEIITVLKSKNIKYDRISAKIFDKDGIHIGNICIVGCYRKFESEDFKNTEIICECLGKEIQKSEYYQKNERIFEETIISKLIENETINKNFVENIMVDLYSNFKKNLYVAIIDITKYENTLTHLVYFRDLFKKKHSEYKYFIYLNNIVAIISSNEQALNINKDLNELKNICIANNIYMGISSSFQNLFELKKYYKQALNALNYGLNINTSVEFNIYEYDNFRLNCFLNTIKESIDMKDLCHPIIFSLREYDKKHGVSYFNFLHTYFLVGRDFNLAAKTLNMSQKDFHLQLENITNIFGIDWTNGDMVISIFESLNIAKNFL